MPFVIGPSHDLHESNGPTIVAFAAQPATRVDVFTEPGLVPRDRRKKEPGGLAPSGSGKQRGLALVGHDGRDIIGDGLVALLRLLEWLANVATHLDTRVKQINHRAKYQCFQ